jgi:hypothetical protein
VTVANQKVAITVDGSSLPECGGPDICLHTVLPNSMVSLNASAPVTDWQTCPGQAQNVNPCSFKMDTDVTVQPVFGP